MSIDRQEHLDVPREEMADYVADLQFHMTLHARKLVPNLSSVENTRDRLLQDTQAEAEKYISRQSND